MFRDESGAANMWLLLGLVCGERKPLQKVLLARLFQSRKAIDFVRLERDIRGHKRTRFRGCGALPAEQWGSKIGFAEEVSELIPFFRLGAAVEEIGAHACLTHPRAHVQRFYLD